MIFDVIDTLTGKLADTYQIAKTEDWANNLLASDIDGFALHEDGTLLLIDDCNNIAYPSRDRFNLVFENTSTAEFITHERMENEAIAIEVEAARKAGGYKPFDLNTYLDGLKKREATESITGAAVTQPAGCGWVDTPSGRAWLDAGGVMHHPV